MILILGSGPGRCHFDPGSGMEIRVQRLCFFLNDRGSRGRCKKLF